MDQENIHRFTGRDLVRDFRFNRMTETPRLTLTIEAQQGAARLVLVNPYPYADLFAIVDAEELWISEAGGDAEPGAIRVEYWADGFHQFSADAIVDLDQKGYETDPGSEMDYMTGPVKLE